MPCSCEHLEASQLEIEASRILCLLHEIETGSEPKVDHWGGYHPSAYNKGVTRERVNALTANLCERLQETDATKYSLELQMWWRNHQRADKQRAETELMLAKTKAEKDAVLAKLTPHERKLIGL